MRRMRRAVVVLVVLLLAAGCALTQPMQTLGDAGFSTVGVTINTAGTTTTLEVVAYAPPGVPREVAVAQAERILWHTQRTRIDRLVLVVDGVESVATRDELTARHGPRDPALDEAPVDPAVLVPGIVVGVGLAFALGAGTAITITMRRRRRIRASGTPPHPLWAETDLLGARSRQFTLDSLVASLPVLAAFVAVLVPSEGPWPLLAVVLLTPVWGWFTYAWWPARHGGRTFAMRRAGLRVVTTAGEPASLGQHTVRWLLLIVDGGFNGLIGWTTMANSARHQRLGDMAAGTLVVRAPGPDRSLIGTDHHAQATGT